MFLPHISIGGNIMKWTIKKTQTLERKLENILKEIPGVNLLSKSDNDPFNFAIVEFELAKKPYILQYDIIDKNLELYAGNAEQDIPYAVINHLIQKFPYAHFTQGKDSSQGHTWKHIEPSQL